MRKLYICIAFCLSAVILTPLTSQGQNLESHSLDSVLTYVTAPIAILRDAPNGKGQKITSILQYEKIVLVSRPNGRYFKVLYEGRTGFIYYRHIDIPEQKSPPEVTEKRSPRTYFRGPNGGCFYITPAGNKQYVKPEVCDE